jgi:hypothetical protein
MDFYQRGKIEVCLNGQVIGYVNSVGITRNNGTRVNLGIEGASSKDLPPTNRENYDDFFRKLNKAFSKE